MGGRGGSGGSTSRTVGRMSKGERTKFFAGMSSAIGKGASQSEARAAGRLAVGKYRAQKNRARKST